jgi:hypothetical protein
MKGNRAVNDYTGRAGKAVRDHTGRAGRAMKQLLDGRKPEELE